MRATRRQFLAAAACSGAASAQRNSLAYPPTIKDAVEHLYKTAGPAALKLYVFNPPGHSAGGSRPAIVFFFGGGWRSGSPKQFEEHCRHLAARGMVSIAADYRVLSRHGVPVSDCVRDAKSAIRWVRAHAAQLGVDRRKVAAGGGSAGGHLAAAAALLPGFDQQGENAGVSARPDALVLFNPALILAEAPEAGFKPKGAIEEVLKRLGAPAAALSPYHHVAKGAPPTIIFHGKADSTVPYNTAEAFTARMKAAGNRCELEGYDGQAHGFFNYGMGTNPYYKQTLDKADRFLVSLGYLKKPV